MVKRGRRAASVVRLSVGFHVNPRHRFGIFVDAGYLYAASGKLCFETVDRSKLVLRVDTLHPALVKLARDECELEHLRTLWYDGAPRAQPTSHHLDIAILPGIKLPTWKADALGPERC